MKCICCETYTISDAVCNNCESTHGEDRLEVVGTIDENLSEKYMAEIIRSQWWDRQDGPETISPQDIEKMYADNHGLLDSVIGYMLATGRTKWFNILTDEKLSKYRSEVTPTTPMYFRVNPPKHYGRQYRQLLEIAISHRGYLDFFRYDQMKVKRIVMEAWPLTKWPEMETVERKKGIMMPLGDGRWTCHLALNNGQIVGGSHITDYYGRVTEFKRVFEGAAHRNEKLSEAFGQKHVAPATVANLIALIERTDQPLDTKVEAWAEIYRLNNAYKVAQKSFQLRLNTKRYEPDGKLHRYAYTEKDNFPIGTIEERECEHWNRYINYGYELFSQQKIGCEVAWAYKRIGLWYDMRVGKTLIGIALAARALEEGLIDRVVIVCPVSNMYSPWQEELSKQNFTTYICDNGKEMDTLGFADDDYDSYIISYESLRNRLPLMQSGWDMNRIMVIMDETSAIKNANAQRTKAAQNLCEHPEFVIALNGTPMEQGPKDIYSQQYAIDRGRTFGVNEQRFVDTYMFLGSDQKWRLRKGMRLQFELALAQSSVRYIRSEADQFSGKDKNFRYVGIPYTEEMAKSTKRIIDGFQIDDVQDAQLIKSCILVTYGHMREACAGYDKYEIVPDSGDYERRRHKIDPKITWIRTFLQSNPGQPIVVYTEFSEAEDRLMEMLDAEGIKYGALRYKHGSTLPARMRQEQIDMFNRGDIRVFICKTRQARGITLNRIEAVENGLGTYPSIVYLQPTWSLGDWAQSQDRCVGTDPNTKKSIATMVYVLVIQNSIEAKIVAALRSKKGVADSLFKDAERDGYVNPFDEMDMKDSGDDEMDELFDAFDYEARYQLSLPPPPRKLTPDMIKKANVKYMKKKYGRHNGLLSEHALYLTSKLTEVKGGTPDETH